MIRTAIIKTRRALALAAVTLAGVASLASVVLVTRRADLRAAGDAPRLAFSFAPEAGTARTYDVAWDTRGEVRDAVLGAGGGSMGELRPFRVELAAEARWIALGAGSEAGTSRVHVTLRRVRGTNEGAPLGGGSLARSLEGATLVVTVARDGGIATVEMPKAFGVAERNAVRSVLALGETVSGAAEERTWSAARPALEGAVLARYTLASSPGEAPRVHRLESAREETPLAFGGSPNQAAAERLHDGECTSTLERATGLPFEVRCTGTDTRRLGGTVLARQESTFALTQTGASLVRGEELAALVRASAPGDERAVVPMSDDAERAARRRDELVREAAKYPLNELVASIEAGARPTGAARVLDAHLALRPESADVVGKSLERLSVGDDGFHPLAAALGRAGSPEAQRALIGAVRKGAVDPRSQALLVAHAGMAQRPGVELEQALVQLARGADAPAKRAAELGLGNVVAHLRTDAPARATALAAELATRLGDARDDGDRMHFLRALGNSGHESIQGVVAPYLRDDASDVRASAAMALQHVATPAAFQALAHAAKHDASPVVRARAIASLSERADAAPAVFVLLLQILSSERDEQVARAALEKLAALAPVEPRAPEALRRYLDECGLESLCRTARMLLGATGPG